MHCLKIVFTLITFETVIIFGHQLSITFDPPLIRGLKQWDSQNISFTIAATTDVDFNKTTDDYKLVLDLVQFSQKHRQVIEFVDHNTYDFKLTESEPIFSSQLKIKALFLGYSNITFHVLKNDTLVDTLDDFSVSVIRKTSIYDALFGVIIVIMVTINYINMGCHLDLNVVKQTLKTPIGPIIGFVCQFSIMPLGSYLIGWLIFSDDINLRLGLFTLGCSPGGNSSNFWTLLFNGDVNLSITMTFISTIAALVMMPFWLFTLGRTLFPGNIKIPYFNLMTSLIMLTFPMVIGLLIKHYRPNWAKISHKIIKPFTIVVVTFGILGSVIIYNHIFVMFTWPIVFAGALVAIIGYSLGAIISTIFRMKSSQIVAISIETAYQNGSIAFILLLLSLEQPDSDIASVPCIAQLLITGQPLWFVYLGVKIYQYFKNKEETTDKVPSNDTKSDNTLEKSCYDGPYNEKPKITNGDIESNNITDDNNQSITKI